MVEKSLVLARPLTPDAWRMILEVAPVIHMARWFGVANREQAAALLLKGWELGMGLGASLELIYVVQGRPCLSPRGALALIQNSLEFEAMRVDDLVDGKSYPCGCRVWMKRRNGFEYTVEVNIEDVKRAGLLKPDSGWVKWPANMYRWRAVGFCADVVFPDLQGGMKRADEFGANISPDGDVIEGTWSVPVQTNEADDLLRKLLAEHTAQEIMNANGGRIPATLEEVRAVSEALAAPASVLEPVEVLP